MPVQKLTEFISSNNQFSTDSDLWKAIKSALNVTDKEAQRLATTHCNVLSLYAILYAQDLLSKSYADFFTYGIKKNYWNTHGEFPKDNKPEIFKDLGINIEIKKYSSLEEIPVSDKVRFYQIKIEHTDKAGQHFISGYSNAGSNIVYLADSNNRGIGVSAATGFKSTDKLIWLKEMTA